MQIIADLHLHSRFSRAVSKFMTIPTMSGWAKKKGINLVGTGDFTHPIWVRELQSNLTETADGIFRAKGGEETNVGFMLTTELSSIYSYKDKTRRVHYLIFAPDFKFIEKFNKELSVRGVNLMSDGRPILGLSVRDVAEIAFSIDNNCIVIPAHVWTPWFSMYGSMSGFDSIEECFGEYAKHIHAVETGLSSDPAMNWRIEELENRQIVSFGDAHSPAKLGREATVFDLEQINFENIRQALAGGEENKIVYTIEFYPEEGKYHYTGHRKCNVVYSPNETRKKGLQCPVCTRPLTGGVMSRIESLARYDVEVKTWVDKQGVRWILPKKEPLRTSGLSRRPYVMLVPLAEIISEAIGLGVGTKGVENIYESLIDKFGNEFEILLKTDLEDLRIIIDKRVVEGIKKVRSGDIHIDPGYDGVFGKVNIWKSEKGGGTKQAIDQKALF